MAHNKVVYNGETLIDLTGDTVTDASHIMSGYIGHLADGTKVTGTGSGGSNKNVQYYMGTEYIRTTSYTGTGVEITVTKDGTYTVSWMAWRSASSGTSGTQLHINGRAYGSAYTTWTHNYGQCNTISGVELSVGDVVEVYARARSTSHYTHAGNLIIEEE